MSFPSAIRSPAGSDGMQGSISSKDSTRHPEFGCAEVTLVIFLYAVYVYKRPRRNRQMSGVSKSSPCLGKHESHEGKKEHEVQVNFQFVCPRALIFQKFC